MCRVLDISWNQLNADTKVQKLLLKNMFASLTKLEVLSVAYNRLGDEGCNIIMEVILLKLLNLRVLDMSYCFISNNSLKLLGKLISGNPVVAGSPKKKQVVDSKAIEPFPAYNANSSIMLRVIIIQGNSIKPNTLDDLKRFSVACNKKLVTEGVHAGIDVAIKYEQVYNTEIDTFEEVEVKAITENENKFITDLIEKLPEMVKINEQDYMYIYYRRHIELLKRMEKVVSVEQVSNLMIMDDIILPVCFL